ncbi:hypothetical protein COU78_04850 [Candidatus Peregrinibacteria bacterium CG10_big_fil_rev_8_21_14_0_10_49_24]|nr:MAG: hypothetical protein COV83_03995 [Candidatus Peregrinibacteria bacterium CG11_big_fil_rev_8_21_14_0_20_49_14]PIR50678.1 MAG: hypothetical protein COU78_04850 [Candidatus Peregrinibacteria bacterium CG10_big_fil_rev_8_21_14_0_10_49_24]PJA67440.1 MAG: hypothetical protein CO157_04550 [Candidatus Peregrinibacteria bacterium CG_4_9_14_3_um_filter_49_12]
MIHIPPRPSENPSPDEGGHERYDSTPLILRFRTRAKVVLEECRRVYERHNKFRHLVDAIVQGKDDYSELIEELSREQGGLAMLCELEKLITADKNNAVGNASLDAVELQLGDPHARIRFAARAEQILKISHELTSTVHSSATVMRCIAYGRPAPEYAIIQGTVNIRGKAMIMMFERALHAHPMGNLETVELPEIMNEMAVLYRKMMKQ